MENLPNTEEAKSEVEPQARKTPTRQSVRQKLQMGYIRYRVANEFAASNPSLKLDDQRLTNALSSLKTPTHPPYALMINSAIAELNEEGGTSETAISEFIAKTYENLPLAHEAILKHHLWKLCEKREVMCTDSDLYILPANREVDKGAVKMKRRKRKRGRERGIGIRRPSKVKSRGKKGIDCGDIGEENRPTEREVGGDDKREEVEKSIEVHVEIKKTSMKSDNGVSKDEADPNLDEEHNEVAEVQQLGLDSEKIEPQSVQTELAENQLRLEEILKQSQQDTTELNRRLSATPLADPSGEDQQRVKSSKSKKPSLSQQQKHSQSETQRRKLRSYNRNNAESDTSAATIMPKPPLISDQAEQCQSSKRKRGAPETSSEAEPPSEIRPHQNEPSLKLCLRTHGMKLWDQNEKELSLPRPLPQRILRSHFKKSSVPDSSAPILALPSAPSDGQSERPGKRRGRSPKPKPDSNTALVVFKPSDIVPRKGRGGPRKVATPPKCEWFAEEEDCSEKSNPNVGTEMAVFRPSGGRGRGRGGTRKDRKTT